MNTITGSMIRAFLATAAGALLTIGAVGSVAAQTERPVAPPDSTEADPALISPLDEQLAERGDDEETEREAEPSGGRGRRGAWSLRWRLRASSVLQRAAAYGDGVYAGGRSRLYQRLDLRKGGTLHAALLTEKDPGEPNPADFFSGMASLAGLPGGLRIVAGDFRLRSGQGLLFGSPRSFGKGTAVIEPALREGWGIPDGLSTDEANYFRGIAAGAGGEAAEGIVFGSLRRLSPLFTGDGNLRGIDRSGYHRTQAEIERRGALTERTAGGMLRVRAGSFLTAGAGALISRLEYGGAGGDLRLRTPGTLARTGIDLRALAGPLTLFGEAVLSRRRTPWIAGVLLSAPGGGRIVVVRRHYPPSEEFVRTFGFGDASGGRNESGTYAAAEAVVAKGLVVSGFLDLWSDLAPGPGAFFPASGADRSISIVTASSGPEIEARYRSRVVSVSQTAPEGEGPATPRDRTRRTDRLRFGIRWKAAGNLSCRIRIEKSVVTPGTAGAADGGLTGSAEVTARALPGVTCQARMELFDAASDASGFTSVEPDLPGTMTGTGLTGEGSNWYLLLSWRLSPRVRISMKYSRFRRDDVRRIGTGAGEYPSNIREKAGVQLDLAW